MHGNGKSLPLINYSEYVIDVHRSVNPGQFCFIPVATDKEGNTGIIQQLAFTGAKPPVEGSYKIIGYIYEGAPDGLDQWERANSQWLSELPFK